jgi:hypothetical protein
MNQMSAHTHYKLLYTARVAHTTVAQPERLDDVHFESFTSKAETSFMLDRKDSRKVETGERDAWSGGGRADSSR